MRTVIVAILTTVTLGSPVVASAESWILWAQEYNGEFPNASLVRTNTLGVYPASAPCAAAAREHLTVQAREFLQQATRKAQNKNDPYFIYGKAEMAGVQETTNPPGARVEITHMTTLRGGRTWKELNIYRAQCWPPGVTPR